MIRVMLIPFFLISCCYGVLTCDGAGWESKVMDGKMVYIDHINKVRNHICMSTIVAEIWRRSLRSRRQSIDPHSAWTVGYVLPHAVAGLEIYFAQPSLLPVYMLNVERQ